MTSSDNKGRNLPTPILERELTAIIGSLMEGRNLPQKEIERWGTQSPDPY
jgi:hypothetical protein